jgi:SET domain-containing protein
MWYTLVIDENKSRVGHTRKLKLERSFKMKLTYEHDEFEPWSDAVDTWERIQDENKEDAFWQLMEESYGESVSEVQVNNDLWHEWKWVYEMLGIEDED